MIGRIAGRRVWRRAVVAMLFLAPLSTARALDEGAGEKTAIDACEKQLCTMLLLKSPKGSDLQCQLTKTWAQSTIKEAESQSITWGHGDARCSVDLNITRAAIISAMTDDKFTYEVPVHTANCIVEQDGGISKVTAKVAPKIVFKGGKAEKIWINLKSVDAPGPIKATIWTAAELADKLGLFHSKMVKSVNKFVARGCVKKYPQIASAAGIAPVKSKVRKPDADKPAK